MKQILWVAFLATFTFFSTTTNAHHSFSATFTSERKSTITGTVNKFSFKNPHVLIYIDVTNDDGSITEWVSEGSAATNMRRQGWARDTISEGQLVRVSGDATHDGSPMTSIDYVEILDPDSLAVVQRLGEDSEQTAFAEPKVELIPLTLADGKPNLTAVWSNRVLRTTRPGKFESINLNSKGQALQDQFDISTDPQVFCDPVGLVRQVVSPHPAKITQLDDRVIFEYEEFGGRREVFFDDRDTKHFLTHYGDSIARYQGDRLIIETRNLLPNQATNLGYRLSEKTTVIEAYSRADTEQHGATLQLNMVVSDPEHLAEDIIYKVGFLDQGDYEFIENDCQPPLRERVDVHPYMNFFLTSVGPKSGTATEALNAHCGALAAQVGQGEKNWVAYSNINPIDAPGEQVWYNAKGQPVATSFENLSNGPNNLNRLTAVTERGERIIPEDTTVDMASTGSDERFYCLAN